MSWLQGVADFLRGFWPLFIVDEWERGGFYTCGRWKREVGPGLHWVIPWFQRVTTLSVAPSIIGTSRADITLADDSVLTFQATATVRVVDVERALNKVDDYQETTRELLESALAEELMNADPERFTAERRKRLFTGIQARVAAEAAEYGVELTKIRFTSLVHNPRVYRLLTEGAAMPW